jgi:hypothetical protein
MHAVCTSHCEPVGIKDGLLVDFNQRTELTFVFHSIFELRYGFNHERELFHCSALRGSPFYTSRLYHDLVAEP